MAQQNDIVGTTKCIEQMEALFDRVLLAYETLPASAFEAPFLQEAVQTLRHYYFDGEWMHDFALDEEGCLPNTLKRGVLSEDGLYNVLCDLMA